jgi:TrmH family RNA methyltransferase
MITSRQHTIVKEFRALARGSASHLLLDGWHLIEDAARARVEIESVAISGTPPPTQRRLLDRLSRHGAQVLAVSAAVLDALSPVQSPTGAVARARKPQVDPNALVTPAPALVLAAAGLQDPGNAGAVIRSAAAAGGTGVLLDGTSADPWGWKALRSSMGSAFHVPVLRSATAPALIESWRQTGIRVLAAVPRGGVPMGDADLRAPAVVLLGGEGSGLSSAAMAAADERITIPMQAGIESLNVAVAAAVLLYEARRQRQS